MKKQILFLFLTIMFLMPLLSGYDAMHSIGNRFASDGILESYTPQVHLWFSLFCLGIALFSLGLLLWSWLNRKSFAAFWSAQFNGIKACPRNFAHDTKAFFQELRSFLRENRADALPLLIIVLCAAFLRIWLINRPMTHDEAYTVVTWGSGSMRYAISDYQLPNNHVFHTILVNLIYHTLGKTPALLRLAALIPGILQIPAIYVLGKLTYNSKTGLLSCGLAAFSSFLIDYSTNARGYSILVLCSILIFIEGYLVLREKNRFIWLLLILTAVIGFYTLPMMLYPFGALCVWLFISALTRDFPTEDGNLESNRSRYSGKGDLIKHLIFAGLCVILLTILCYLPILMESGIKALIGNVFVLPVPQADFVGTMKSRGLDFVQAFTEAMPPILQIAILTGNLISLLFHRKISKAGFPVQLAMLIWLVPVWIIQRPNLWPRTLIFLWPFLLMWGAAGLHWLIGKLATYFPKPVQNICVAGSMILIIAAAAVPQIQRVSALAEEVSLHEQAILKIIDQQDEGKVLFVVAPEDDAPLWYYADRYDLPKSLFDRNQPFSVVYAYVNPMNEGFEEPRDLQGVLARYGPGDSFIEMETAEILMESDKAVLYRFKANQRIIEKTFGTSP